MGRESIAWIIDHTKLTAAMVRQEFSHAGGESNTKTKERVGRVPPFVLGSQTADVLGGQMEKSAHRQALSSGFEQITRREGCRMQNTAWDQMVGPIEEAPELLFIEHTSRANATPGGLLLGTGGFRGLWEVDHVKPW